MLNEMKQVRFYCQEIPGPRGAQFGLFVSLEKGNLPAQLKEEI